MPEAPTTLSDITLDDRCRDLLGKTLDAMEGELSRSVRNAELLAAYAQTFSALTEGLMPAEKED
jgi:hypothetical protein